MAKKSKSADLKEIAAEKRIRKSSTDPDFSVGNAFVEENTGSATMINVDGRWDFSHPPAVGGKPSAELDKP